MKLARVTLDFPYRVPGSVMEQAQNSISEDETSVQEGKPGAMHYDAATHSLVFDQAGVGINWAHVVHWEKLELGLVCEVCGEEFRSAKALGGHRRHCKQKE